MRAMKFVGYEMQISLRITNNYFPNDVSEQQQKIIIKYYLNEIFHQQKLILIIFENYKQKENTIVLIHSTKKPFD